MKKGQKRFWKAIKTSNGEVYRKPAVGYPITINGRTFYVEYSNNTYDLEWVTDAETGMAALFRLVCDQWAVFINKIVHFPNVKELALKEGNQ